MLKSRHVATLVGALLLAGSLGAHASNPLSLGEQFALRSYTGQAIGLAVTDVVDARRVGIISNESSICASLTGAIGAQVVARAAERGTGALSVVNMAGAGDGARAFAAVRNKDAVVLSFGGQVSMEENQAMVRAALRELAANNYGGAIVLHVRVWATRMVQRAASEDAQIAQYLAGKNNVFAVAVDADNARAVVHQVSIDAANQRSVRVLRSIAMGETWLGLFRRSI